MAADQNIHKWTHRPGMRHRIAPGRKRFLHTEGWKRSGIPLTQRFDLTSIAGLPAQIMLCGRLNDFRKKFTKNISRQGFRQLTGQVRVIRLKDHGVGRRNLFLCFDENR